MAKGKGKAMIVTIHLNSGNPCKRIVVFLLIAMTITIHMRYEEMNLYRDLVWEQTQAILAFGPTQTCGVYELPEL
ncbi:unnamed protein product [Prunus armeniaca]